MELVNTPLQLPRLWPSEAAFPSALLFVLVGARQPQPPFAAKVPRSCSLSFSPLASKPSYRQSPPVSPLGCEARASPRRSAFPAQTPAYWCREGPPRSRVYWRARGRSPGTGKRHGQRGGPAAGAGGHGRCPGRLRGSRVEGLLLPLPRGAAGGTGGAEGLLGAGAVPLSAGGLGGKRGGQGTVAEEGLGGAAGKWGGCALFKKLFLPSLPCLVPCCEQRKWPLPTTVDMQSRGEGWVVVLFFFFLKRVLQRVFSW